jgi:glyoxylase-like metal-dependent hydrolase (beta-lactamase superfamily II)
MIFRQLMDPESFTYTSLLGDEATGLAVLIDPVLEQIERDCALLGELGLRLHCSLETHVHADHVTASGRLRERFGSKIGVGARAGGGDADWARAGTATVEVGDLPREGDALLVRGCGRTDFQQGNAQALFRSVRERIFALPDATLLYPAHDYQGRTVTSVAEEKRFNPRLGLGVAREDFLALMTGLRLAAPKRIDVAVPANLASGLLACAAGRAEAATRPVALSIEQRGRQDAELFQGSGI